MSTSRTGARLVAEVQAGQGRPRQEIMQVRGGVAGAEASELFRRVHDDRGQTADRHALRLTGRRKPDDLAEPRPGLPELPAGFGGGGRGGCAGSGTWLLPASSETSTVRRRRLRAPDIGRTVRSSAKEAAISPRSRKRRACGVWTRIILADLQ